MKIKIHQKDEKSKVTFFCTIEFILDHSVFSHLHIMSLQEEWEAKSKNLAKGRKESVVKNSLIIERVKIKNENFRYHKDSAKSKIKVQQKDEKNRMSKIPGLSKGRKNRKQKFWTFKRNEQQFNIFSWKIEMSRNWNGRFYSIFLFFLRLVLFNNLKFKLSFKCWILEYNNFPQLFFH